MPVNKLRGQKPQLQAIQGGQESGNSAVPRLSPERVKEHVEAAKARSNKNVTQSYILDTSHKMSPQELESQNRQSRIRQGKLNPRPIAFDSNVDSQVKRQQKVGMPAEKLREQKPQLQAVAGGKSEIKPPEKSWLRVT